ncbi:hypothetical protein [Proteus mirabilis]|uniref:hypothetical protein n=1 Tax=Proteus mirabilis TaxID=584 RepID=UPI002361789F|nr:hypothetical protein [Proteus mirabilis]MDC9752096.1 hypothetical protein [Proteus mirabilis]
MKSGLEVKNGNDNLTRYLTRISRRFFKKSHKLLILNGTPTGFNIKRYDIDYKHLNFIQFCIMPPIMPPFYFVTQKLRGSGFSFPKATSVA